MGTKTIYLIDGSSFAYRAFYAIGQLTTQKGQPTNAVYGFTRMLLKLMDRYKPEYLLMVFDTGKSTFRHKQYKEYKAHRKPMPDDMISQMPWIKKIISAYNIPLMEMEGYEADDILAAMAVKSEEKGFNVNIVTSDKDMMQLVNSSIKIISPAKEDLVYDSNRIKEKYGVPPHKITHLLALTGDSSDNIPGVPGVGEKTAARLLQEFNDIDGIFNNLNSMPERLKTAISEHKQDILSNLSLVTVRKDIDLFLKPEDCLLKGPNKNMLKDIFRELEFNALLKGILENDDPPQISNCMEISTPEQWRGILDELKNVSSFGITEDGFAYEKDNEIRSVHISNNMPSIWEDISILLQNPDIKIYGHDIKFLKKKGLDIKGGFFDTYIAESLLDVKNIEKGPDLAVQVYKSVPELEKKLINEGLFDLYHRIELPLIKVLADMENCGIKLDVSVFKKLSLELENELKNLTEKIHKLAGEEFNINSPKQLEYILFEKLALPKGRHTKTGFSTDVDVLESLAKYHELPKYILDYRQVNKLKGTYVDPLPELIDPVTQRLHTTFNQVGAVTGRLSSSNPNLQNIPIKTDLGRRIRMAFIPGSPDFVFLGADYSQIELRVLAHLCGDEILVAAFLDDKDIHTQTAQEIFGVSLITPDLRRQAKMVNFGILYGMGARAMSENLGISMFLAQGFIDKYFSRYTGVAEYIKNELNDAKENGYVVTMFGRKRRVPELASSKPQIEALGRRIAINTPIQGSSADIIKIAMINIHRKITENKFNAHMLLQVHDELIFEVHKDYIDEVSECVKKEMESVVSLKVPLKVDIKIGQSWADL